MARSTYVASRFAHAILIIGCAGCATPPDAQRWLGHITLVVDGDTVEVTPVSSTRQTTPQRIRLHDVDCPELNQPFGAAARDHIRAIGIDRLVEVTPITVDIYDRLIADVRRASDTTTLEEELLHAGLAWHDTRFASDSHLAALMAEARRDHRGLWTDPDPIPPWKWRQGVR